MRPVARVVTHILTWVIPAVFVMVLNILVYTCRTHIFVVPPLRKIENVGTPPSYRVFAWLRLPCAVRPPGPDGDCWHTLGYRVSWLPSVVPSPEQDRDCQLNWWHTAPSIPAGGKFCMCYKPAN